MKIILVVLLVLLFHSVAGATHRSLLLHKTWREAVVAFVTRYPDTLPLVNDIKRPPVKFRRETMWWDDVNQFYVVGLCVVDDPVPITVASVQVPKEVRTTLIHEFLHYLSIRLLAGDRYQDSVEWIERNY